MPPAALIDLLISIDFESDRPVRCYASLLDLIYNWSTSK